ncbi:hypothetical protein PR048_026739 [Dryococelus australis]|uniref:HAT C-terminal dimerisation domain-containing protein n=1 Tax=Dryococelus australis TaxID=614101 RepID=A0ABQ9GM70_9NEOP|nr:hypothetical protein PR048_026739 [Dryococelus australis]
MGSVAYLLHQDKGIAITEAAPLKELGQNCTPTDTSGNSECNDLCTSQTSALVENLEDKDTDDLGTLESGSGQPKLLSFPKTQDEKQSLCFSPKRYETYPWLEYSMSKGSPFRVIGKALSEVIEEGKDKYVVTAMGILSSIKTPNFIVCLFTMDYVLSLMNVLSNYFQKEETTLGVSARLAKSTLATLKGQRDKFDDVCTKRKLNTSHTLHDYIVESTLGQTVEAVDGEALDKEYWCCHIYYAVFDSIKVNMENWFCNLEFAESVDCFQNLDMEGSEIFLNVYKNELGINYSELKSEVSVFKNLSKTKKSESECDHMFIRNNVDKSYMPNLYKGLQLAIRIPVSSAGAERCFSAMQRVKTWLRSTTGQERFSFLSLTHIEAALLKELGWNQLCRSSYKRLVNWSFKNQKTLDELLKMNAQE